MEDAFSVVSKCVLPQAGSYDTCLCETDLLRGSHGLIWTADLIFEVHRTWSELAAFGKRTDCPQFERLGNSTRMCHCHFKQERQNKSILHSFPDVPVPFSSDKLTFMFGQCSKLARLWKNVELCPSLAMQD